MGDDIESQSSSSDGSSESSEYSSEGSSESGASSKNNESEGGFGGFFKRHILIIGLSILAIIGVIVLIWMFTVRPHQEVAAIGAARNKIIAQQQAAAQQAAAQSHDPGPPRHEQSEAGPSTRPKTDAEMREERQKKLQEMDAANEAAREKMRQAEVERQRKEQELKAQQATLTEIMESAPPAISQRSLNPQIPAANIQPFEQPPTEQLGNTDYNPADYQS